MTNERMDDAITSVTKKFSLGLRLSNNQVRFAGMDWTAEEDKAKRGFARRQVNMCVYRNHGGRWMMMIRKPTTDLQ